MQLIGGDALLDSMKLVEICLALEDLADENGFELIGRLKLLCLSHAACFEALAHWQKNSQISLVAK